MRVTDLFLALPQLPLLLLVVFFLRDRMRQTFGPEVGIFVLIVCDRRAALDGPGG